MDLLWEITDLPLDRDLWSSAVAVIEVEFHIGVDSHRFW